MVNPIRRGWCKPTPIGGLSLASSHQDGEKLETTQKKHLVLADIGILAVTSESKSSLKVV